MTDHSIVWDGLVKLSDVTGSDVLTIDLEHFVRWDTPYPPEFAHEEVPNLLADMVSTTLQIRAEDRNFLGSLLTSADKGDNGRFVIKLNEPLAKFLSTEEVAYTRVFDVLAGRIGNAVIEVNSQFVMNVSALGKNVMSASDKSNSEEAYLLVEQNVARQIEAIEADGYDEMTMFLAMSLAFLEFAARLGSDTAQLVKMRSDLSDMGAYQTVVSACHDRILKLIVDLESAEWHSREIGSLLMVATLRKHSQLGAPQADLEGFRELLLNVWLSTPDPMRTVN